MEWKEGTGLGSKDHLTHWLSVVPHHGPYLNLPYIHRMYLIIHNHLHGYVL